MKQYKDIIHTVVHLLIMVLLLVIAGVVENELLKGILLFLFSGALIGNTIYRLIVGKEDRLRSKVFYSVILFFYSILAIGACSVIIMAIL
jgi:hypothetical protein